MGKEAGCRSAHLKLQELGRQRQEDLEFKASLGCTERSCLKKKIRVKIIEKVGEGLTISVKWVFAECMRDI
jgi:hypothetical protein